MICEKSLQPQVAISEGEYVAYTKHLREIKVIEQCCRKQRLFQVVLFNGRFVKHELAEPLEKFNTIFEKFLPEEIEVLRNEVSFINAVHHKLTQRTRSSGDYASVAAEYYNENLKIIFAWNQIFIKDGLRIDLPAAEETELEVSFAEKTTAQAADEKALARYFELLAKYPKLKRDDELNDYRKGAYQIIYDPKEILTIREEIYQRFYHKAIAPPQELAQAEAEELATNYSRPGVVCEDQYWLWIRDVVISPQGYRHTYNRIVWKTDLERVGGAAALPIIIKGNTEEIVVQLAFRHATNGWELEMPRGASKVNETPMETAKREVLDETGFETDNLVYLGSITPDSGVVASVVPIYLGKVTLEQETKQDKTEAIKGKYTFTLKELMEGLKQGYMELEIDGQITRVPIRDPFLTYALLMSQYKGYL